MRDGEGPGLTQGCCPSATLNLDPHSPIVSQAMCYIKMSAWKKALAEANEALALDNNSAKGWFRKANALENLKVGVEEDESGKEIRACPSSWLSVTPCWNRTTQRV